MNMHEVTPKRITQDYILKDMLAKFQFYLISVKLLLQLR